MMYVCWLSHFSHVQVFETLWTVACQDPLEGQDHIWTVEKSLYSKTENGMEEAELKATKRQQEVITISSHINEGKNKGGWT